MFAAAARMSKKSRRQSCAGKENKVKGRRRHHAAWRIVSPARLLRRSEIRFARSFPIYGENLLDPLAHSNCSAVGRCGPGQRFRLQGLQNSSDTNFGRKEFGGQRERTMLIAPAPLGSVRKTSELRMFSDARCNATRSVRQDPSANTALPVLGTLRLKLIAAVRHE